MQNENTFMSKKRKLVDSNSNQVALASVEDLISRNEALEAEKRTWIEEKRKMENDIQLVNERKKEYMLKVLENQIFHCNHSEETDETNRQFVDTLRDLLKKLRDEQNPLAHLCQKLYFPLIDHLKHHAIHLQQIDKTFDVFRPDLTDEGWDNFLTISCRVEMNEQRKERLVSLDDWKKKIEKELT